MDYGDTIRQNSGDKNIKLNYNVIELFSNNRIQLFRTKGV